MKFNARIYREKNKISFYIPPNVINIVEKSEKNHNSYMLIELGLPRKPRTTGRLSQNHAINGYIQQIASETGNDFQDIKNYCKKKAIRRGYPMKRNDGGEIIVSLVDGEPIPESESNISTIEAGYLLDEIIQLAAELEIRLET